VLQIKTHSYVIENDSAIGSRYFKTQGRKRTRRVNIRGITLKKTETGGVLEALRKPRPRSKIHAKKSLWEVQIKRETKRGKESAAA